MALLLSQLAKLDLSEDRPPSLEQWRAFIAEVRMTEALDENELRFRRLFESGIFGMAIAHPAGRITEANDALLAMLGYSREDLLAGKLDDQSLTPNEWRHLNVAANVQLRDAGMATPWEKEYLRKDGSRVPVLVGVARLEDDRNISVAIDLSEQKRAEARKSAILDRALDAIVGMDHLGRITEWNPAAEETFGYSRPEVLGKPLAEVLIPPRLRDPHQKGLARYLATGQGQTVGKRNEFTALRRDQTEIPIELAITRVGAESPPSFIGFIRDVSERKRAEVSKTALEEQLRQAQKMEAVGCLAGGVAHDFNNILSVILSYSAILADELPTGDPLRADVTEILSAGRRASDLTRQLLALSRQQVLQSVVVDLNELLGGMERMLRRLIREDVELTLLLAPKISKIRVDPGQIEQVIMNLAVNARDAMPQGGKLYFKTADVRLDENHAEAPVDIEAGDYVLLTVSDMGAGMDDATRLRIFEPFFTTKELGKGTGLGLSTVFGIVKQSRGHISVQSEIGKGTTFKIFLPKASASSSPAKPRFSQMPARDTGRVGTILLVEDDDPVRAVARSILGRAGYVVLEASNGKEALVVCGQSMTKIDLLLSDVVMPGMGGRQLAMQISEMRPEMKVILMSGYTDDPVLQHSLLESGVAFLQKPLTPGSLLRKVDEVLSG